VLNIGSIQGFQAQAGALAYAVSKGGVHNLTRALAVDLAAHGVLVNALAPGFIDTPMAVLPDGSNELDSDWFQSIYVDHGRIPLRRAGKPDEVAAAAEFFVSIDNTYVTGAVLTVDGGMTVRM
jgi:3-oxoacyl-[acyl-carrier protein] reductase